MTQPVRTHVMFQAAGFNTTEDKEEFLNMGNFGNDVAEWLVSKLQTRVPNIDPEIGQEDAGWYFTFTGPSGTEYDFLVGWNGESWLGWFERSLGLFKSIFGLREKKILRDDLIVVNLVLKESDRISNVRWYYQEDIMKGNENAYSSEP